MHLAQRRLDAHVRGRKVGVGRHHTDDTAGGRIQTRRNHTQHHILAGEDTRDRALVLHQKRGGVMFLHERRSLLHGGPHRDGRRRHAVQDGFQGRTGHLGAQGLDVLDDLLGLAGTQFGLDTLQRIVQLAGGAVGTLQLLHRVVEALGDIKHTRNILVLIHHGQMAEALPDHQVERIRGAGVGARTQGVLGHDLGHGDFAGLGPGSHHAERQILGGEDAGNAVIIVGHQHTVLPLRGHQLGGLGDRHGGLDLQGLAGLEGQNGSGRGFAGTMGSAGLVLLLAEVGLDLSTDCLFPC